MKKFINDTIRIETLIVPAVVIYTLVFIYPLVNGILLSLTDWNGYSTTYDFVGIDNYLKIFQDPRFNNSLKITIKYLSIIAICPIVFGYISSSYLLLLKGKIQVLARTILLFPFALTPVIVGAMWDQIYYKFFPWIGKLLSIPFLEHNLLSNPKTALFAVAFVDCWTLLPLATILFLAALESIPKDVICAAMLDGANEFNIFLYIKLPYLSSTLVILFLMYAKYALTSIDLIITLTGGGPGRYTETFYYLVYKNSSLEQKYSYGLAEGLFISFIILCIFMVFERTILRKNNDIVTMEI
jgi:raffinose/stachyose/melibiose transport system permease protein